MSWILIAGVYFKWNTYICVLLYLGDNPESCFLEVPRAHVSVLSVSAGTSLRLVLPIVVAVGTPGKSTGTPCLPTVLDFTPQILFMLLGVKAIYQVLIYS